MKCDVIVIGGGPAGMMASIAAAESGARVVLLEPNSRLGKKLNITGKGRCNLTNNCPPAELMQNIPRNSRFLYSAFSQMNSQDVIAFFEGLGVPVKTERGNRVFPVSDRSFDVSAALERRLKELGVVILRDRASGLLQKDSRLTGVRGERETYTAPCAVVATGGLSYPLTGSTGDGYRLSEEAGHTVTSLRGSLVPLEEEGSVCAALQGLSLRNVRLTVLEEGRSIFTDFGELQFTHFGLSGPLVLSASAHMRDFEEKRYTAVIDLKPALDQQQLDRRILADFEKYRNSDFVNALNDLLPHKFINVFVEHSRIPPRCKVHSVTREQRQGMAALLKAFPIPIRGPRPVEEAIITAGGVAVEEINPSTMESKKLPGLYFAGEVIDVDAYTGGFNLQIAWATGYVAGQHAAWASQG